MGKVKPGKREKPWITPTVKAAIKKRNRLRDKVRTHRAEWIQACKEAARLAKEAKEEKWFDFLADLETDPDPIYCCCCC